MMCALSLTMIDSGLEIEDYEEFDALSKAIFTASLLTNQYCPLTAAVRPFPFIYHPTNP